MEDRGRFLLDYIDLLLDRRENEARGFRHMAPGPLPDSPATGRERWVINKLRALCAWYSKGLDAGSHLRVRVNSVDRVAELRGAIEEFFLANTSVAPA
jgi:tRNA-dihydrouridine synthase